MPGIVNAQASVQVFRGHAACYNDCIPKLPRRTVPLPLVLIVDDNPDNLNVVGELLVPRHAVRVANGGARALQLARMAPLPDLILLDVMMPGIDGFEVLRQLRDHPHTADIPVVLLTALDSDEDEERGLALGAADYLTKPVRPGVLLARVGRLLAQRSAGRRVGADIQRLEDDLQRHQADLVSAQESTLRVLLDLQEARDPDATQHRLRTQAYLHSLCQVLRRHPRFSDQLDDRQINLVLRAAPLHDIGLLGLPDQLLAHPGPLDTVARQSMQAHTVLGADVLARVWPPASSSTLPWAREIARSHHERWDGRGYPDGLAGDSIPWAPRLMAVVDAYDALTMPRPYRAALAHADAVAVLASERGRQFDPDVTDAFVDVCHAWPAIGHRHG
jgi:putative two-component system response regulator